METISTKIITKAGMKRLFTDESWTRKDPLNKLYFRYLTEHFGLQIKIRILDNVKYTNCRGCRDNQVLKEDHTCISITTEEIFAKYWDVVLDNIDIEMAHHTALQRLYEHFHSEDVKKNVVFICIYNQLHAEAWKKKICKLVNSDLI